MAQVINTNVMSLNAQRNLNTSQAALASAVQRLSSGLRVNSAKDDAAGLAIAERMNAQVRGMNVAIRNANDAISLSQTAEGALGAVGDMLQRMRELAVQSANATNNEGDRTALSTEFQQLQGEIARVLEAANFNNTALFTAAQTLAFQVGAGNASATNQVSISVGRLHGGTAGTSGSLTTTTAADVVLATVYSTGTTATRISGTDAANARNALLDIDLALTAINQTRATFGAAQNRFESVVGSLQIAVENTSAARSRIMDANFAAETAALTRAQILQQAGTAMLAQANAAPQNVLALLRG